MTKAEEMIAVYKQSQKHDPKPMNSNVGKVNLTLPVVFTLGVVIGMLIKKL